MAFIKAGDKAGEIADRRREPIPFNPPPVKYVRESAEDAARTERALSELAGKPVYRDGQVLYKCAACHDMGWLRVDVPVGHKLFGKKRLCPCNPQYAIYGGEWR